MPLSAHLGIDIGTSVTKGTILSKNGDVLAQTHSPSKYGSNSSNGYEHDPESVWWVEFLRVTKELLNGLDKEQYQIDTIAVTGMIPNITPISANGKHLHNSILFYDGQAFDIEKRLDEELKTPKWHNEVLSKLIWLKAKLGNEWEDVRHILTTHSYIVFKLTGKFTIDRVTAIESGNIYKSKEMEWNNHLLQRYSISPEIFPRIYAPKEVVGSLTEDAAKILGLKSGIPVVAGTGDTISTILGAGLRKRSEMLIYYGTYNCSALLKEDIQDTLAGKSVANPIEWTATIPRSGQQISVLAQQLFPDTSVYGSLNRLDTLASESVPGANGVIFIQTIDFPSSTVSTEPRAAIFNYTVNNTIADICRAVLEAFGYGLRYSYEVLGSNPLPTQCYAAGGGARSFIWKQIISDITGLAQVYIPAADRGLGSAVLAGLAVDPDFLEQVSDRLMLSAQIIQPIPENREIYDRRYKEYSDLLARYNV